MLKGKNQNLEFCQVIKRARTFYGPEESFSSKRSRSIKQPKKDKIYHITDHINFSSFCHLIKSASEKWSSNKKYNKTQRLLDIDKIDA